MKPNGTHWTTASLLRSNIGTTTPQSIKSDKTTNRTVGDIQKETDAQFEDEKQTCVGINHSGSQRRENPWQRKVIQASKRWTKTANIPASMTSPSTISQKGKIHFWSQSRTFSVSYSKNGLQQKEWQGKSWNNNTTVCSETQLFFYQQRKKKK